MKMHMAVILGILSLTLSAQAQIKVGTKVTRVGWIKYEKSAFTRTGTETIVDLNAKSYLLKYVTHTNENNEENSDQKWIDRPFAGWLPDGEGFTPQKIRATCDWYHGKIEMVKVPAGTFQTCKVETEGFEHYTEWYGAVPFVVVKSLTKGPQATYGWELESFSY